MVFKFKNKVIIYCMKKKKKNCSSILKYRKNSGLLTFIKKKSQYLNLVKSFSVLKQLQHINNKKLTFFNLKLVLVLKYYKALVKYIKIFILPLTLVGSKRGFWNFFLFSFFKESLFLLQFFKKIKKRKKFIFFVKDSVSLIRTHSDFKCNFVTNSNIKKIYIKKFVALNKSLNIYNVLAKKNKFFFFIKSRKKNIFFSTFKYIKIYFLFQKKLFNINNKFLALYKHKYYVHLLRKSNNNNLLVFATDFINLICSRIGVFYLNLKKKNKFINNNIFFFDFKYLKKCSFFFNINWCLRFVNINFMPFRGIVSNFLKINNIARLSFLVKKTKHFCFYFKNKRILLIYDKKKNQQQFWISNNISKTKYLLKSKILTHIIASYYAKKSVFNAFKFIKASLVKKTVHTLFKVKFKNLKRILRVCNRNYYKYLFFQLKKLVIYKKFIKRGFSYFKFRNCVVLSLKRSVTIPHVFINSIKLLNNVFFNKNYLLFTNKLCILKKFNLYFSSIFLGGKVFRKVKCLSTSKQIFIYLRYLVLCNKSNSSIFKARYRKKRNKYLTNYLNFFKFKRFFFFNLTLAFFWKKRTFDFIYSAVLKKYRFFFFHKYKNVLCKKEKQLFNYSFLFKIVSAKIINKKVVQTVFFYKQISSFFFKYKYYIYLKKNSLVTPYFIYNTNYLSWNFLYFWYWYFIAFLFKKSIFDTNKPVNDDSFSTINSDDKFIFFTNLVKLNSKKKTNTVLLNFIFQILFKYILLKNSNIYNKLGVNLQVYKWKKHFTLYKKFYKKFLNKFKKRNLLFNRKIRKKKKKLKLRLKSNNFKLTFKKLSIFTTCGYYDYFKRKFFRKRRLYKFFLYYFKKTYKMQNKKVSSMSISNKIGIINIVTHFNNTYVTLTDIFGNVLFVRSGGLVGIKGPNRSTSVTSEEVTWAVCSFLKKTALKFLIFKISGVLYSRKMKAAFKIFKFQRGYKILRVFNNTAKAHNGIRLKKKRRL